MNLMALAMIMIFLLSFIIIPNVSAEDNSKDASQDLNPISIPAEKNSQSSNNKANMKHTGVPIALGVLSLIVSIGVLAKRD